MLGSVAQPGPTGSPSERQQDNAGRSDHNTGEQYFLSLTVTFCSV